MSLVAEIDRSIFDAIVGSRNAFVSEIMREIGFIGNIGPMFVLSALVVLFLLLQKRKLHAGLFSFAMIFGTACMEALKFFVRRPRPPISSAAVEASGWSFPSGHAMLSTIFFLSLLAIYRDFSKANSRTLRNKSISFALLLAPFLIGVSRIYLGVHWPSDVLSGFIFGIAIVALVFGTFRKRIYRWEKRLLYSHK